MLSTFSDSFQIRINVYCQYTLLGFVCLAVFSHIGLIHFNQIFPVCFFYSKTGLYCPACGGTRAFLFLIHGQIFRSLSYHLLPVYGFIIMMTGTINLYIYKPILLFRPIHFIVIPFIMILNALIHNLLILCENIS